MQGIKNGALLRWLVENHFEVLVAKDRNIPFQNPLHKIGIAGVVVRGHGPLASRFIQKADELRKAVSEIGGGESIGVFAPNQRA